MIGKDVMVACRSLIGRPGLSLGVVLTLALGIGATTTVYSVVEGVVLRPLSYEAASTLVTVGSIAPTANQIDPETGLQDLSPMNSADYEGLIERATSFQSSSTIAPLRVLISDEDGFDDFVAGASVGPDFFSTLGVSPSLGRTFLPEEFELAAELERSAADVAMISYGYWQRRYGGDPGVLGRLLEPNGTGAGRATVVGILPESFRPPEPFFATDEAPEVYSPMRVPTSRPGLRVIRVNLSVIARLTPTTTLEQARAEVARIATEVESPTIRGPRGAGVGGAVVRRSFGVNDLHAETVGTTARTLWVFLGAASLLLLLAAMNAASLLLARALDRRQEIGVRVALGAGRGRLVRLLLVEAGVLTVLGGALGVVVAYLGVGLFHRYAPATLPRLADVAVDARALGMAAAVSVAAGLAAGLLPALRLTHRNPWERMREGGRSVSESAYGLRSMLVGGQLALAVVLLAGAGLLFNSFMRVRSADPGFEADGLIALTSTPTEGIRIRASEISTVFRTWDPVLAELAAIPGVLAVGGASNLPFQAPSWAPRVLLPDDDPETVREGISGYVVTPGYLETMGTELRRGRTLQDSDGPDSERVVVVNESFVRTQMPGVEPLNTVLRRATEGLGSTGEIVSMRVVGIIEDVVQGRVEDGPQPAIYIPYSQADLAQLASWSPALRTNLSPTVIGQEVRRAMSGLGRFTQDVSTLEDRMSATRTAPLFRTLLIGTFGGVALLLAAMGLYGSLAESVGRRRREIGIRMALGADAAAVLRMVTGQGMRLSLSGLALGLVATVALSRVLASFLYDLEPFDPLTLGVVAMVFVGVSAIACLGPARRATSVDPVTVLNAE